MPRRRKATPPPSCWMGTIINPCMSRTAGRWCRPCSVAYTEQADRAGTLRADRVPEKILHTAIAAALARKRGDFSSMPVPVPNRLLYPRRAKRYDNATIKIKRPAVILHGGPRDGWGYYRDDLLRMIETLERSGTVFPYRPTKAYVKHPGTDGTTRSQVWEFVPVLP